MIVEECMKWSMQRNVFGKPLIQQPVIRFKLGQMIADVEAVHSMLEDMTHQMVTMSEGEINASLAGPIALLKYKQTRVATMVSDHACQIFGGRVSMPSCTATFLTGALTHNGAVCGGVGADAHWHGIGH
jgi:alkylation response protein AidB-like acyl-CoA dehydrogenase